MTVQRRHNLLTRTETDIVASVDLLPSLPCQPKDRSETRSDKSHSEVHRLDHRWRRIYSVFDHIASRSPDARRTILLRRSWVVVRLAVHFCHSWCRPPLAKLHTSGCIARRLNNYGPLRAFSRLRRSEARSWLSWCRDELRSPCFSESALFSHPIQTREGWAPCKWNHLLGSIPVVLSPPVSSAERRTPTRAA